MIHRCAANMPYYTVFPTLSKPVFHFGICNPAISLFSPRNTHLHPLLFQELINRYPVGHALIIFGEK